MDLILDAFVTPKGKWHWKDREGFERAVAGGLLDSRWPATLAAQAARIRGLIQERDGPFASGWIDWSPPPSWPTPALPEKYAIGGAAWARRT